MATVLVITGDFESTRTTVMAAMLYPRNEAYRAGYCLRDEWSRRLRDDAQYAVSASDIQAFLDLPSRQDLRAAAEAGTKRGSVAGDLLRLAYEDWRLKKPEPSIRSALRHYRGWSPGKKYGNGSALLYSDAQLRLYFAEAEPAAHLWAAFRLLKRTKDRDKSDRSAFTPHGMPTFLGVAKELQDFATTFVPKRAKPAKPLIDADALLQIPMHVHPIRWDPRPL